MSDRDDFHPHVINGLRMRAAFICSNPDCRCHTIAPSEDNELDCLYIGIAAHITAASEGGPRYDPSPTSEQRRDISNGIFLCASCAIMIDKNNGVDFPADVLRKWKSDHDTWVRDNLNKSPISLSEIAGLHEAHGIGDVTGLRIARAVKIKPGTVSRAKGIGKVTGTSIK